jgi:hypothetical protein
MMCPPLILCLAGLNIYCVDPTCESLWYEGWERGARINKSNRANQQAIAYYPPCKCLTLRCICSEKPITNSLYYIKYNLSLVNYVPVWQYLTSAKGYQHVDFTNRVKANLGSTFVLNSRYVSFSLPPSTSQFLPSLVYNWDPYSIYCYMNHVAGQLMKCILILNEYYMCI